MTAQNLAAYLRISVPNLFEEAEPRLLQAVRRSFNKALRVRLIPVFDMAAFLFLLSESQQCGATSEPARGVSLVNRVFVNPAILHDHQEVLLRIFDQFDIRHRIAIDQQQIRKRTFFYHT